VALHYGPRGGEVSGKPGFYIMIDDTHDPDATSWVESANAPGTDFPVQNLPFAVFRRQGTNEAFRGGVAIGALILDLAAAEASGGLGAQAAAALRAAGSDRLNGLMALGKPHWSALRQALFAGLKTGSTRQNQLAPALIPQAEADYALPAAIGDFTDFYASIHHATAVGAMLRPQNPLLPNYKYLPVAYHGRSSSVALSGQRLRRPSGQQRGPAAEAPSFGPSTRLDFELELGFFIGPGNDLGHPIEVAGAEAHVFGACILNDWSARDIQAWEYQPLGPFLSKSFATTISPWIVTIDALAPFRAPFVREASDPALLPHLALGAAAGTAAFDVRLDVALQSTAMQAAGMKPQCVAHSNYRYAYWTLSQMVTHHTSNGCNMRPGDLLGTGTLSGPGTDELGSMLEITQGGRMPVMLHSGEQRSFVEDGDSVVMRAWCDRAGARRIGFGACVGTVVQAI
jgi:fumarylacetoacetase